MQSKHTSFMSQLRVLESEDRQAANLNRATASLKAAGSLANSDTIGSVDNIAQRIHEKAAVATEDFNSAVGGFAEPADPIKDAAVDDIIASLR